MATETSRFDTWLKEKLLRDVLFRCISGALIPIVAISHAMPTGSRELLAYVIRMVDSVMYLLDTVGFFALFVAVVSLILKDFEALFSTGWGQETSLGGAGGVIRRLGGDMTNWLIGAVMSMLIAVLVALFIGSNPIEVVAVLSGFLFMLCFWLVVLAGLSVLVRRQGPTPWAFGIKKQVLAATYGVLTVVLIVIGLWG